MAQDENILFEGPQGDPHVNFHCLALASKYHRFSRSRTPNCNRQHRVWVTSSLPPSLEVHFLTAYNTLSNL